MRKLDSATLAAAGKGARETHQPHLGQPSVQEAAMNLKSSALLMAPSTVAEHYGPSPRFSTTSSHIAAACCPESNASVNSSSAAQQQRVCTNCRANRCPANTWRAGPAGPQTLCNRCGLRYRRHGAGALNPHSRAASAAAPELAAVPAVQLPTAQPRLARGSSSCSNYGGKSDGTAASTVSTAALPDAALVASKKLRSLNVPSASVPLGPARQSNISTEDHTERSDIRKSLRQKRPRVRYGEGDSLEPVRTTTAKQSSSAVAVPAATGSKTCRLQRQKRPRDPSGEADSLQPGKVPRPRKLEPTAAAAASGGFRPAGPAIPGPGAVEELTTELAASGPDVRAEAVRMLSLVAPGASGFRVRKSYRVAQRVARQFEAVKASTAAAAEVEVEEAAKEAADILVDMAGCCWVDNLVAVLGQELDVV